MDEKMKAAIDAACKAAVESVQDAMLICAPAESSAAKSFPDNAFGECGSCGRAIVWRPHAEHVVLKVCVPCGLEVMRAMEGGAQ